MTAADQSPFAHAARELGVWLDTVSYEPLDPDEAPRWLADQDMTARLQIAIQELLALCADNVEDTRLRVLLAEFSTEACAKAGVTARTTPWWRPRQPSSPATPCTGATTLPSAMRSTPAWPCSNSSRT